MIQYLTLPDEQVQRELLRMALFEASRRISAELFLELKEESQREKLLDDLQQQPSAKLSSDTTFLQIRKTLEAIES